MVESQYVCSPNADAKRKMSSLCRWFDAAHKLRSRSASDEDGRREDEVVKGSAR